MIVVDAEEKDDGTIAIDVALSSGARRGDVVRVVARGITRSWVDLLAAPGTLIVRDGAPHLTFD